MSINPNFQPPTDYLSREIAATRDIEPTFPVAETFYSIQGEGLYAGTPMFFIRLAGCNVGRYMNGHIEATDFQVFKPQYSTCTSYSGTQFVCDTDYRVKERLTIEQLDLRCGLSNSLIEHVSITGGEPLIHKHLLELIENFTRGGTKVHLETSGTLEMGQLRTDATDEYLWITCSPKHGYLNTNTKLINQFKFLVETQNDVRIIEGLDLNDTPIFIQPIERYDSSGPIKSSYDFVVDVVKKHPNWRLSLQLHKILGVR